MSLRTETSQVKALSHLGARVDAFLAALDSHRDQIEAFVANAFDGDDISWDIRAWLNQLTGHPKAQRKGRH